ncbi:hypothetical protein ACOSQ2_020887 [Xanthoceras sorbifolium]
MSRPARGTTATAGPVNPVGNTASLREQTLEAATATGSRAVGVQVRLMRAGDGSLRDTAGSRTNSAMQIPAMASRVVAAGGAHAAPMGAGKGGAVEIVGAVAAGAVHELMAPSVARSSHNVAHVHGQLAREGAANVYPRVAPFHELESAAHVQPCLDLSIGHDSAACVNPCTALVSDHAQLSRPARSYENSMLERPGFGDLSDKYWSIVGDGVVASGQKINFDKSALCASKQVSPGFLWGLNIPAKVRMFVWRACRNLLPTRSLLAARRVPGGAGCPLCGAAVDSVLHSLWLCRSLVEPKAAVPFLVGLRLPVAGSFFDFILACYSRLLVHEMELLLVLLWRFWFRRNRAVHSAQLLSVEDTVDWSKMFLADFQAAVAVPGVRCGPVAERWLAPSPGWVKIHSDVAVDVRGRRLGFGVVLRDFAGKVLMSYTSLLLGLFSSDIGEALAILYGLRLAVDLGLSSICVESDAASIVKQLSSRDSSCSDIGLILDDILSLVVNLSDISFSSVRRCANKVAHGLAKLALWHQPVGVQFGDVSSSLALLILDDSRALL